MKNLIFSLKELCREAQVTERTVRYYIQEGLLPPPEGAGPFARYNELHLWRLRLIRRLKKEYLPLAEIRRRLSDLSLDELEKLAQPETDATELDEEEADAKNYLDRILSKPGSSAGTRSSQSPHGSLAKKSADNNWLVASDAPNFAKEVASSPAPALDQQASHNNVVATDVLETWHHVTLAPGVVLQFRANDPILEQQVQELIAQARQIFRPE